MTQDIHPAGTAFTGTETSTAADVPKTDPGAAPQGELSPCPFCGGIELFSDAWRVGWSDEFIAVVECQPCDIIMERRASTEQAARASLLEHWSRRAASAGLQSGNAKETQCRV